jgi:uncharacterized delta-60 repeat protein
MLAGSRPQHLAQAATTAFALLLALSGLAQAAPGDLDRSFGLDGKLTTDFAGGDDLGRAVAVQVDGKIVVAGSSRHGAGGGEDFALLRYNADGTLDGSFSGDGRLTTDFAGGNDSAETVAVQADGKIVVAGASEQGVATGRDFALARYNADGTLDGSFSGDGKQTTDFVGSAIPDFAGANDFGQAVAIQADGKIVVAGYVSQANAPSFEFYYDFALARYNADGSLDGSFSGDGRETTAFIGGADDVGVAVALQADGKIVVGGWLRAPADSPFGSDFALARYDAAGRLDSSFSDDGKETTAFASDSSESISGLSVQADGKIVVGGWLTSPVDSPFGSDFALARYDADGALDSSFSDDGKLTTDFAGEDDLGRAMAVQVDGKIVVVGFSSHGAAGVDFALARYDGDGTLDNSFSGDGKQTTEFAGGNDVAAAVALQADGKIVAAGSSDQGVTRSDVALARYEGVTTALAPSNVAPDRGSGVTVVSPPSAAPVVAATCDGRAATMRGSPVDDNVVGTPGNDVIVTGAGDDDVDGRGGQDRICSGTGDDGVRGGMSGDHVFGGAGDDRVSGGRGNDRLSGGPGNDRLNGNSGNDRLFGGAGHDRARGGRGYDRTSVGAR